VRDVIRVEEKITESGHLIPGEPKTERSRRAVTLPHGVTLELAEHIRRYPPSEDGLVFTAEQGGVIRRPAFGQLVWRPAVLRAGLEVFRFGQLRHTGATLALEAGANPVLVAFRLGHTSTRMLEQHYAGRLDRADRELARTLDAAAQMRHAGGADSSRTDAQQS
jgi:integrase